MEQNYSCEYGVAENSFSSFKDWCLQTCWIKLALDTWVGEKTWELSHVRGGIQYDSGMQNPHSLLHREVQMGLEAVWRWSVMFMGGEQPWRLLLVCEEVVWALGVGFGFQTSLFGISLILLGE